MAPYVVKLITSDDSVWPFISILIIRQFIIYSTECCSLVDVLVLLTLQLIFKTVIHRSGDE